MALLGLQDVSAGYGGPPLLEHMDFQIERGEHICLLGRNGVGKSTLMKLICSELESESGIISNRGIFSRTSEQKLGRWRTAW